MSEKQQTRFDGANEIFKTAKRGFHKEMGLFNASMEFFICILSVVVIAVGGWLIMKGQMDLCGAHYLQPVYHHLHQPHPQAGQLCRDVLQRLCGPSPVH